MIGCRRRRSKPVPATEAYEHLHGVHAAHASAPLDARAFPRHTVPTPRDDHAKTAVAFAFFGREAVRPEDLRHAGSYPGVISRDDEVYLPESRVWQVARYEVWGERDVVAESRTRSVAVWIARQGPAGTTREVRLINGKLVVPCTVSATGGTMALQHRSPSES